MILKADLLAGRTDAELADAWCVLNSWGWPAWIPDPEAWGVTVNVRTSRRVAIMDEIVRRIGKRRCLERWRDPSRNPVDC